MSPKYFQTPFAGNGDKAEIKDLTQPDGTVSYQEGYGHDYETNPAANGGKFMFVERSQMNGLLNDITDNLKQWQEQGYYTYNPAVKYGIGGRCNYNDGTGLKAYVSNVDNNNRVPSVNGVVQSGWILADLPPSMQNNMLVGQPNGAGYQNRNADQVRNLLGISANALRIDILTGSGVVTWPTRVNLTSQLPTGRLIIFGKCSFGATNQTGNSDFAIGTNLIPHWNVLICNWQKAFTAGTFVIPLTERYLDVGNQQIAAGVRDQWILIRGYIKIGEN